jgi:2-C-methyl-D-erythritol 2,4-cyclodiphosphate synthase/2-C-methyl-D-erythritol 4-phosphate cytidylyltransferase
MAKVSVIIAAAGSSRRMSITKSKQLYKVNFKPILEYSLIAFSNSSFVDEIIIATKEEDLEDIRNISLSYPKVSHIVLGGKERFDSVSAAFDKVSENSDIVAIHDAARPLIDTELIDEIIEKTVLYGAVCPVGVISETVKKSSDAEIISATLDRNTLYGAQTPQTFKKDIYKKALDYAKDTSCAFTDDASIVERSGTPVHMYVNKKPNIKLTYETDLDIIKHYLEKNTSVGGVMRVGHGYDVHKLVENRDLILGGVKIDYTLGLLGHSDADVLVHAIMDALIGAMALGDIGKHFPDTDDKYKGISSILLLKEVKALMLEKGYTLSNIDATVIAHKPKLLPFIEQMIDNIAKALECDKDCINIKATTEEGLGFTGDLSGISAHAVAMLYK